MNIRLMVDEDRTAVLSWFSKSYKRSRDVAFIHTEDWGSIMRPVLERVLRDSIVLVAAGELPWGFIAFDGTYVLYLYVTQPFRRRGVARALLKAAGINPAKPFTYAARTRASWLCRQEIPMAVYDPYRARGLSQGDKE